MESSVVLSRCYCWDLSIFYGPYSCWTVRRSNPDEAKSSTPVQTGPGAHRLLYNRYRVTFPGLKRSGRGVDHAPLSSAEVKERVELYISSPPGPSRPILEWILRLPLPFMGYVRYWSISFHELIDSYTEILQAGERLNVLLELKNRLYYFTYIFKRTFKRI